ncbi:MAG: bacteriohemerythrin [Gallionella sp.]|nr:bacteriohemerythrin [Gallionella sp.]
MKELSVIFPWNPNFETGVAIIDEQHKKLVDLLNALAEHLAYGSDAPTLERVFDELTDYTVYHFQTEEKLWHQYLPQDEMTLAHERTHLSFVNDVMRFRQDIDRLTSDQVVEEVVSFLTHWLAFHILETDKHMSKILLALQQGQTLEQAKAFASVEMSGAMRVLIETILKMYDNLSTRTLQLMREIAERQRAEARLRLSKDVIDSTLEAIFVTTATGEIIDTNPAFSSDVDATHEALLGRNIRAIKPTLFTNEKTDEIWEIAAASGHWAGEIIGRDAHGAMESGWLSLSAIRDKEGEITHYVGVLSSIRQLIARQQSLEQAANFDMLTGLPNRRLLKDRLDHALRRSQRSGEMLAICFLDLDGFKQVNDQYGHDAGDELLRVVGARLGHLLRGEDTVARLGGDEFVLLFESLHQTEDLPPVLERVLAEVALPIICDGRAVQVTASIGATVHPRDNSEAEQLLAHADQAMYEAKRLGKSRYSLFVS